MEVFFLQDWRIVTDESYSFTRGRPSCGRKITATAAGDAIDVNVWAK